MLHEKIEVKACAYREMKTNKKAQEKEDKIKIIHRWKIKIGMTGNFR